MRYWIVCALGTLLWAQPDPQAKEELNKNIRFYRSIARRTAAFRTKALPKLNGIRWQLKIVNGVSETAAPVAVGARVYIGGKDKNMYAVNVSDGKIFWKFTTGDYVACPAAYYEGKLYFGSDDGFLYALDESKKELWRFQTNAAVQSPPAITGDIIVFGSHDYNVYALDRNTGEKLWEYTTGRVVQSGPAIAEGVVYVGSDDYALYALSLKEGKLLWQFKAENEINTSPTVAEGFVYFGSDDGTLYALDAKSGMERWRYATGGKVTARLPWQKI